MMKEGKIQCYKTLENPPGTAHFLSEKRFIKNLRSVSSHKLPMHEDFSTPHK